MSNSPKGRMDAFWRDDFTPLQAAGKAVLAALRDDEEAPDADLYRRILSSGPGSHLYYASTKAASSSSYSTGSASPGSQPRVPPTATLKHQRSVPLPQFLVQELQKTSVSSLMGLFPEADLAWMSVDDQIYLWSYDSSPGSVAFSADGGIESFCSFVVPSCQNVISVGLVRPKKGVFKDIVEWCLVVATRDEVILCALAHADVNANGGSSENGAHGKGAFRLIPTRYIIPTDSVPVLSVCGTSSGRIFLGGFDGNLYEMDYEGFVDQSLEPPSLEQKMAAFYNGDDTIEKWERTNGNNTVVKKLFTTSKRALSSVVSPSSGSDASTRPHKCRKLNHSSRVSSIVSAVLPDFVIKASSSVLGSESSTGGGPIERLLVDEERSCIYTLSSLGWICVFDLGPTAEFSNSEIKLMAVIDTPKTARSYLEAVSRGRMYPPTSSGADITFPGGGASAQAGVGGMDGARSILKLADAQVQRERSSGRGGKNGTREGVLTPVSIHAIPRKESGRLTLVAVTKGGLRYYLSSLSSSVLNAGPGQHTSSSRKSDPLAPSRKFTLCHIRAPPPVGENGVFRDVPSFESDLNDGLGGFTPKIIVTGGKRARVDASYYDNGVSLLALEFIGESRDGGPSTGASTTSPPGDTLVAATPDSVRRKKETPTSTESTATPSHQILTAPGGVSETLHQPMTTLTDSSSDEQAQTLPGGRVWAINSSIVPDNYLLQLTLSSQTPSDSELSVGLVPEYFPPSRMRSLARSTGVAAGPRHSSLNVVESTRSNALVLPNSGIVISPSTAAKFFANFLLSRPLRYGLSQESSSQQTEPGPGISRKQSSYRISTRFGFGGFGLRGRSRAMATSAVSVARSRRGASGSTSKSARLSPWLLRPAVLPLNPLSIQHLTPSNGIVALNSGGLHYFQYSTVLSNLTEAIMSAGANIGRDETVTSFFRSYGYKQGCAMCLCLAVGCGPGGTDGSYGEELRSRALQAALNRGLVPRLLKIVNPSNGVTVEAPQSSDPAIPRGYEFRPSALVDGFTSLMSRLLRPVWYKPAVVITEGRSIRKKAGGTLTTPARVEFLLDDVTSESVRTPLFALQSLMKAAFPPAVTVVPGVQRREKDAMDVDEDAAGGGYDLFTRAMQHQGLIRSQVNGIDTGLTSTELESIARLVEERNLHSFYRLLSRTVQLLDLLSLLKRAQEMSDLPEVEWGLIHGLTFSQLVQKRNGQERIENLLNSLVSSTASAAAGVFTPSADSDRLANLFASQCYLYFSPGSRLAYLGFRSANAALSCPSPSARRGALTAQASAFLKRAARYWYSPQLVTGRILHTQDKKGYEQMAQRAMQFDSPLAKAAAVLLQLEDVTGLVDVCLETASNFGGRRWSQMLRGDASLPDGAGSPDMLWWEQGLYHRRRELEENGRKGSAAGTGMGHSASASPSAVAVGIDVTPKDALLTCHAIIFHHLSTLLDSRNAELAKSMVAACAGSKDKEFLHSLFAHLLDTNHVDTLLRIDSKDVEKWLQRSDGDPGMLWRFYVVQGKNVQAGEVMWRRACDEEKKGALGERVECLTRALSSYTAALERGAEGPMEWNHSITNHKPNREELQRIITQIRETLEVASLQNRILNTVTGSTLRDKLKDDQYSKLSSTLVPVSDLYNEFAWPLNLFDLCLLILHSCHHNDQKVIETLWRSVFCEELLPCKTRIPSAHRFLQNLMAESMVEASVVLVSSDDESSPSLPLFENGDWINALKGRVVSLGKEVWGRGANFVFPVEFIATMLEGLRRLSSSPRPWPLDVLAEVGVPHFAILDAYESMVEKADKELMGGVDLQRRLEYLSSVIEVLQDWVSAAADSRNGMGNRNGALVEFSRVGTVQSKIRWYTSLLEGMNGVETSEAVSRMLQTLEDMGRALERIV